MSRLCTPYPAGAGQTGNDKWQEFVLLADILGVEVLVDMLSNSVDGDESESTVLGPFYRENPPVLPKGASTVQNDFDGEESVYFEWYIRDAADKGLSESDPRRLGGHAQRAL